MYDSAAFALEADLVAGGGLYEISLDAARVEWLVTVFSLTELLQRCDVACATPSRLTVGSRTQVCQQQGLHAFGHGLHKYCNCACGGSCLTLYYVSYAFCVGVAPRSFHARGVHYQ